VLVVLQWLASCYLWNILWRFFSYYCVKIIEDEGVTWRWKCYNASACVVSLLRYVFSYSSNC
jgi:hypothetical protein